MVDADTIGPDGRHLSEKKRELLGLMTQGEPYAARELAERVDIGRRTVSRHLDDLAERGLVRRKEHSPRNVTFWIPESDPESSAEASA